MSSQGAGEGGETGPQAGTGTLSEPAILAICDGLLREVGRRAHIFSWLREPGGDGEAWLPVDAYYPGRRLVVVCRALPPPLEAQVRESVPAHGLKLLLLRARELAPEPASATAQIQLRLADLALPERTATAPPPPPGPSPLSAVLAALAQPHTAAGPRPKVDLSPEQSQAAERAIRVFVASRPQAASQPAQVRRVSAPVPRVPPTRAAAPSRRARPVSPSRASQEVALEIPRLGLGVALAALIGAELFIAVDLVGLLAGRALLGLGIALDAGARGLGVIAAARFGSSGATWGIAVWGSPYLIAFVLRQPEGVSSEPAPLGALVGILAIVLVVLGLLTGS